MSEEYTVWSGDTIIHQSKEVPKLGTILDNKDRPFYNCVHRTKEQVDIMVRTCCNSYLQKGYRCIKRDIDFLGPTICDRCPSYERIKDPETKES